MKNWTKLFALILVAAFAVALFAGCQNAAPAATEAPTAAPADPTAEPEGDDPATEDDPASYTGSITFTTWDTTWGNLMTPAFEAIYTGIDAEFTPIAYADYLTKLQTALASDTPMPDVLQAEWGFRQRCYELGIWEPLDQEPYNVAAEDMFDYLVMGCSYDGHIVGLEMQISPAAMAFRRDVAIQYLNFTEDDHMEDQMEALLPDYDSILTVGQQLKEASDGKVFMFSSLGDVYDFVFRQATTPLMPDESTIDITSLCTEMFDYMIEWNNAGIINTYEYGTPGYNASYDSATSLLAPMPSWRCTTVKDEYAPNSAGQWCLFTPPGGLYSWGGTTMGVNSHSENKLAAWKFVEYGCWSEEGCYEVMDARGYQSGKVSLYETIPEMTTRYDEYWKQDLFAFWYECAQNATRSTPLTKYDSIVMDAVSAAVAQLSSGAITTTEECLKVVIDQVNTYTQPDGVTAK